MLPPPVFSDGQTDRRDVAARQLAPNSAGSNRRPTVLLVDDDASVRNSLHRVLIGEELQVVMARGVKDALDHLYLTPPDLVITDLCMIPLSGWDLIIHLHNCHPAIPVFVVTALPLQTVRRDVRHATAFFQKPPDFDLLLAAIRRQFNAPGSGQRSSPA